jgi:hypothetical protein
MSDDITIIFNRVHCLLERDDADSETAPDDLEHTLTDGYARALGLDGERLRIEERIRELAGSDEHMGEARILKARLALVDEELAQLRELLAALADSRAGQTRPLRTA